MDQTTAVAITRKTSCPLGRFSHTANETSNGKSKSPLAMVKVAILAKRTAIASPERVLSRAKMARLAVASA
jgi:hypothetical protein